MDPENSPPPELKEKLRLACFNGKSESVRHLLDQGAKVTFTIVNAAIRGHSTEVFQALLDAGLDINELVGHMGSHLIDAIQSNQPAHFVSFMLEKGANLRSPRLIDQWTPIQVSAMDSSDALTALLIENGVQLEQSGSLQIAANEGRVETVQFLLDRGAPIDEIVHDDHAPEFEEDVNGTSLQMAVTAGSESVVKLLLERGANFTLRDPRGRTALMRAKETKNEAILRNLRDHGAKE